MRSGRRLFHTLSWKDYPKVVTPWRSELLYRQERIDFTFSGKVFAYAATFRKAQDFPNMPHLDTVAVGELVNKYEDGYTCKATLKLPGGLDCVLAKVFQPNEKIATFLELIGKVGMAWQGPYCLAAAASYQRAAVRINLHEAYSMTFQVVHELAYLASDGLEDVQDGFFIQLRAQHR